MANLLTFAIPGAPLGIESSLEVRLVDELGDVAGVLTVSQGIGPGHFQATMTGAAGVYTGLVIYTGGADDVIIDGVSEREFLWDGADLLYPLTTLGTNAPIDWINAAAIATAAVTKIQTGLLTTTTYTDSIPANFPDLAITEGTGLITTSNPGGGGATAAEVWAYIDGPRSLTGPQATALGLIPSILEDVSVSIPALVEAAGFTATRNNALIATEAYTRPMAKQLGMVAGVTATHSHEGIAVSDGDGSTAIADNLDGSYTVSKAP